MNGNKLKNLRESKGILQKELANILGVSLSSISMYERNERQPDNETLKKIANYFNVSIDYLLDNNIVNNDIDLIEQFKNILISFKVIDKNENIKEEDVKKIINFIKKNKDLFIEKR